MLSFLLYFELHICVPAHFISVTVVFEIERCTDLSPYHA